MYDYNAYVLCAIHTLATRAHVPGLHQYTYLVEKLMSQASTNTHTWLSSSCPRPRNWLSARKVTLCNRSIMICVCVCEREEGERERERGGERGKGTNNTQG